MKIGILGYGSVGGTLGKGFAKAGHQVRFGGRHPESDEVTELLEAIGEGASAGTVQETVEFGEVLVLAVPWNAVESVLEEAGDLGAKPLLDATNPLGEDLGLALGNDSSGGERVAELAPTARVVKIFNTTGYENMADPEYPDGAATMFYCGDDEGASKTARGLAADLGFEPVDVGGIENARLLEPLALLWIRLAIGGHGRDVAFRLMRR